MSRNSIRSLCFALVVIASLGAALPAFAAGPADRIPPAAQSGLLASVQGWLADLWSVLSPAVPGDPSGADPRTAAASGPSDPDRGVMIDPNGGC